MPRTPWSDQLARVTSEKVATHIFTRSAYAEAFPAFFRAVGSEVEQRLSASGLETRGHVGADLRADWLRRLPGLPEDVSLNWVAFEFPGISFWEAHIGVLANLTEWPASCTVGFHLLEPLWPAAQALLSQQSWQSMGWLSAEVLHAPLIDEAQLNDPFQKLDLTNLTGEVDRLANRAVQLYQLVQPLVAELAASR